MMKTGRPWMQPIVMSDLDNKNKEEEHYMLPCRGLKLIGIRFYACNGSRAEVKRAMNMQKNLYGSTDWYYFNKGFNMVEEGNGNTTVTYIDVAENAFDSSFLLYSDSQKVNIGVSAIIGQNGTGKSTIVDMVIRLINNLSAAIIGEDYVYSSAQHLHYIDNVYAALAVYIDTRIKILTCRGKELYVSTYETDLRKAMSGTERYVHKRTVTVLDGKERDDQLLPAQSELRHVLKDWFYTLLGNYSLYAYNYRDYESERTSDAKLAILREKRPEDNKAEDEYWLKGVFHKNDGYQTPVVIHPMRNNGYVNAARVNELGKQNLISLAFVKRTGGPGEEKFPFRIINQTHHLVAFYFYADSYGAYKGFINGIMQEKFDLDDAQKAIFGSMEKPIKEFWAKAIRVKYSTGKQNTQVQRAWDYVAYKTIKIFWNYKHYQEAWDDMMGEERLNCLTKHLKELVKDSSHRTLKLRQTLAFLRFHADEDYYMNLGAVVDLDDIYAWMKERVGEQLYPGKNYHAMEVDDLQPPPYPIVDTVLQLVDNEHLQEYQRIKNKSLHIIPFNGLSAGERQIAYTLGNIVYHLKNVESVKQDFNVGRNHLNSLKYDYVNVMLDEVELYFHPDLQRRFVSLLLDAIRALRLDGLSGINVTLITHSPFVLSDIPTENILSLSRTRDESLEGNSFAANIHDLFNNTFFLPYTVGELARREISQIVGLYNIWRIKGNDGQWGESEASLKERIEKDWAKMEYVASIVGDEYLQGELADMLDEMAENIRHNDETD